MEPIRRRDVLRGAVLGAVTATTAATGVSDAHATQRARPAREVVLTATVVGSGSYAELPFTVARGVQRIDVPMSKTDDRAKLGVGLFDSRGTGYQSAGFRGIYGEERSSFFVSPARRPSRSCRDRWVRARGRCRCSALPLRPR